MVIVALAFTLGGCGEAHQPESSGALDVPMEAQPLLVETLGVWCGDGTAFAVHHLDEVGAAHRQADAAAVALRSYLSSREGSSSGATSWIRVAQDANQVQFLGRQGGGNLVFVRFVKRAGIWQFVVGGGCPVRVALKPGTAPIDWRLDPAVLTGPGSLELALVLDSVPCDPGDPLLEHVLDPVVVVRESAVIVAVLGREDRAVEYCLGPIPMPVTLPEPLGGRAILDGGVHPPRNVSNPASG
jgi:hypothetical protein